jgi:NADH dehydrogenase
MGVKTRLEIFVTRINSESVTLSTGERIESLTAVWTAGMVANDLNRQIPGKKD